MDFELKLSETVYDIPWTVDTEVHLLCSMVGHKPVGVNKHFHMAFIWSKFTSSINKNVSSEAIWRKLETMYDLPTLDEAEGTPFPNNDQDFSLPEDIFGKLIKERLQSGYNSSNVQKESEILYSEHLKVETEELKSTCTLTVEEPTKLDERQQSKKRNEERETSEKEITAIQDKEAPVKKERKLSSSLKKLTTSAGEELNVKRESNSGKSKLEKDDAGTSFNYNKKDERKSKRMEEDKRGEQREVISKKEERRDSGSVKKEDKQSKQDDDTATTLGMKKVDEKKESLVKKNEKEYEIKKESSKLKKEDDKRDLKRDDKRDTLILKKEESKKDLGKRKDETSNKSEMKKDVSSSSRKSDGKRDISFGKGNKDDKKEKDAFVKKDDKMNPDKRGTIDSGKKDSYSEMVKRIDGKKELGSDKKQSESKVYDRKLETTKKRESATSSSDKDRRIESESKKDTLVSSDRRSDNSAKQEKYMLAAEIRSSPKLRHSRDRSDSDSSGPCTKKERSGRDSVSKLNEFALSLEETSLASRRASLPTKRTTRSGPDTSISQKDNGGNTSTSGAPAKRRRI